MCARRNANCSKSFTNVFVPVDNRFKFRAYSYSVIPESPVNATAVALGLAASAKTVVQRTMFTYTGIRIVTVVGGRAGKFNFGGKLLLCCTSLVSLQ